MAEPVRSTTVGLLRRQLALHPDDAEVTFGTADDGRPLLYAGVKARGDDLVQVDIAAAPRAERRRHDAASGA